MQKLIFGLFFYFIINILRADSPLTSTEFYWAYKNEPIVAHAINNKTLDEKSMNYLLEDNPLHIKIALINALSWGNEQNIVNYKTAIQNKYKKQLTNISLLDSLFVFRGDNPQDYAGTEFISPEDLTCMAYMKALGDYFNPLNAHYCAYKGYMNKPTKSSAYILALIVAQYYLDSDWCQVYMVLSSLREDTSITDDGFKEAAVEIIFEYINLYAESCGENSEEQINLEFTIEDILMMLNLPEQKRQGKKYADLKVMEILYPEYNQEISGTKIKVRVKNTGKLKSVQNAAIVECLNTEGHIERTTITIIEPLDPGKETIVEFSIPDYWVFNPNAHIKVTLDIEKKIEEKDEKDNVLEKRIDG